MIKRFLLFLLSSLSLYAATYYVASTGSDSSPGSSSQPFLTIQHSVNSMACGDTLIVVANGSYVAGDANLPYFPNCGLTTTIQSSALAQLNPIGWRTNPANDSAAYGKLSFTSQGILAVPLIASFDTVPGVSYATIAVNVSTSTFTLGASFSSYQTNFGNGSQLEFETNLEAANQGGSTYPVIAPIGGTSFLTHYYVVNCGSGPVGSYGYPQTCGQQNSSFQLALTPGGSPISVTSCGAFCVSVVTIDPSGSCSTIGEATYNVNENYNSVYPGWICYQGTYTNAAVTFIQAGMGVQVNTSANTITVPAYNTAGLANNLPVAFSAAGFNTFGTLPGGLVLDQIVYVKGLSGLTFQVSLTPGGSAIPLTSVGTGLISIASTNIPSGWAFRGLEFEPNGTNVPGGFLTLGNGVETSLNGMASNFEVDRCYFHDNPPTQAISHEIIENGRYVNIHDSWVIGANYTEAQAIFGTASPGPTTIQNNFIEAAGEVTLYGGNWSPYSPPNANKLFQGNYFYKPPVWKYGSGAIAATGACLYDTTDPTHAGGEYYLDTSTSQSYQCGSNSLWATVGSIPAGTSALVVKNMTEHKNGRYFSYIGNLYNGSFAEQQSGQLWNNSMEYGSGPGMANDHITIQNNVGFNSLVFMARNSQCFPAVAVCPILPGNHATVNNLLVINTLACGTSFAFGCGYQTGSQSDNLGIAPDLAGGDLWNHNTIWTQDSYPIALAPIYVNSPNGACPPYTPVPSNLVSYSNSIVPGDFSQQCGYGVSFFYSNTSWANNALKNGTSSLYSSVGAGNSFTNGVYPGSNAAIGYSVGSGTNPANYKLAATSPFSAANGSATQLSTDGADLGADIDLVTMATSGAAAGTPPWPIMYRLNVAPGSTGAILSYTAPTSAACTVTVYNSHVRSPANVVATVADSTTASVSDGTTRYLVVPVSTLTASTPYWYGLACGGGVLMVGQFSTLAAGSGTTYFPFSFSSAQVLIYSNNKAMTGATALPSSANPLVPVVTNTVVYVQQSGLTSPGGVQPVMAR
jgi:hypothetical protein